MSRSLLLIAAVAAAALLGAGCTGNVEPRLAYIISRGAADEVYVYDYEEDACERLTATGGTKASPAFSSDGEWIFYASDIDGDWDIYRVPVDGGEVEKLTANLIDDRFPAAITWDEGVVYVAEDSGGRALRVLTEPGDSPAIDVITEIYEGVVDLRWDHRGNFLALTVDADVYPVTADSSGYDIRRYDHGIKQFEGLIVDHADNFQPAWSPDGRWLVFSSNRGGVQSPVSAEGLGDYDIFLYNLDNGEFIRLTDEPGDEFHPLIEADNESLLFYGELDAGAGIYRRRGVDLDGPLELVMPVEGELLGIAIYP